MSTRLSVEGLGDAEPASGFEPVPAGLYKLECVKQETKVVEKSGNTMVVLELRTRDCEKEELNDRAIWHNLVLIKKSAPFVKGACICFGVEIVGNDFVAEDFVGAFGTASLKVTEFQGNQKNEVSLFHPPAEGSGAGVADER